VNDRQIDRSGFSSQTLPPLFPRFSFYLLTVRGLQNQASPLLLMRSWGRPSLPLTPLLGFYRLGFNTKRFGLGLFFSKPVSVCPPSSLSSSLCFSVPQLRLLQWTLPLQGVHTKTSFTFFPPPKTLSLLSCGWIPNSTRAGFSFSNELSSFRSVDFQRIWTTYFPNGFFIQRFPSSTIFNPPARPLGGELPGAFLVIQLFPNHTFSPFGCTDAFFSRPKPYIAQSVFSTNLKFWGPRFGKIRFPWPQPRLSSTTPLGTHFTTSPPT